MSEQKYILFDDPLTQFSAMLDDIRQAKQQILLQTYRIGNDEIGLKFKNELLKKAKEGVEIYLLLDAFGSKNAGTMLADLQKYGVKIKYFRKITFSIDFFRKNHRRNHRKILVIDAQITYIGSANITNYCINWRECCLRLTDLISHKFRKIFFENYDIADLRHANRRNKKALARKRKYADFEIICDVPSTIQIPTRNKFINLIDSAQQTITITTPYFLPGFAIRNAIKCAIKRNVKVKLFIPKHSDVKFFDILRNHYLGVFHKDGVEIIEYQPSNIHAKLLLIDNNEFVIGSSNFDYRSFWWMYEINLCGKNPLIIKQIQSFFDTTAQDSEHFNYNIWRKRASFVRLLEILLVPLRHLF